MLSSHTSNIHEKMQAQTMERSNISEHFDNSTGMSVRQTSRGCLQELCGCEARTEFRWFQDAEAHVHSEFAISLEDSSCCCRLCCSPCHPFQMVVKDNIHGSELFTAHRPCKFPSAPCKCCCLQEMNFTVQERVKKRYLGRIRENFFICVPRFTVFNASETPIYKIHMPTCLCGLCVNCCAEGNPCCGKGCCKVPFYIYPAEQAQTDGMAPIGKIIKKPKNVCSEIFTEANTFDVQFPPSASGTQKAIIAGSSIFLNALFFEEDISKHN